jgi:lipopolysaccharide transport system ATP-binding protein
LNVVLQTEMGAGDYFVSVGIASYVGAELVPHDRRYDSIHLNVRPDIQFFGLCNLEADFSIGKVVAASSPT